MKKTGLFLIVTQKYFTVYGWKFMGGGGNQKFKIRHFPLCPSKVIMKKWPEITELNENGNY